MANRKTATQMLAEACGKPFDEVLKDSSRTFYMSPEEAVEYGLIDKARLDAKCCFLVETYMDCFDPLIRVKRNPSRNRFVLKLC